jgi:four helix bundle protein
MSTPEARVPVTQLVRSSASVAANYRSACRAKSRRDFISKLGTVIEESDESSFWLEYLAAIALLTGSTLSRLQSESNQLVAIFTTSKKQREPTTPERRTSGARHPAIDHDKNAENDWWRNRDPSFRNQHSAINNQQSAISSSAFNIQHSPISIYAVSS